MMTYMKITQKYMKKSPKDKDFTTFSQQNSTRKILVKRFESFFYRH